MGEKINTGTLVPVTNVCDRKCYYQMAREIINQAEEVFNDNNIKEKSIISVSTEEMIKKVKNKISRIITNN